MKLFAQISEYGQLCNHVNLLARVGLSKEVNDTGSIVPGQIIIALLLAHMNLRHVL